MKKLLFLLHSLLLPVFSLQAGTFAVSGQGKPLAEIVISEKADEITKFAADELRLWIREISGAALPLGNKRDITRRQIILTTVSADFPKQQDWNDLRGSDGYAVRSHGKSLYIVAWKSKGLLNGIYRMLMRNSDIIWARPTENISAFFTPDADLSFHNIDYLDRPVFSVRGWQVQFPIPEEDLLWNIRNCSNWTSNNPARSFRSLFRKSGIEQEAFYAHNIIRRFMKRELFWEKHPEYYSMQNGKRIDPIRRGKACPAQLCFSNKEMIADFLRRFEEEYRKSPGSQVYMVSLEDNFMYCTCPKCCEPVPLADGRLLTTDAENFHSTRFYLFLNEVARYLNQIAPGREIITFAYAFAENPPAVPLERNIRILLCPAFRNYRYPISSTENKTTRAMLEKWAASGNKITIYDYYGLYGDFPRPVDRIVQADLLFEEQLKITGVHSEVMQDNERQSCYWCREIPSRQFWDVNSIYIWTATQLLWDPHQDVDKLRSRYLRTVFGAAAPDVAEYLKYTEQVWKENFIPDDFHTNRHAQYYRMAETGMVEKCRLAIARARSREVSGRSRLMMERLFQPFDERAQLFEDFTQAQRFCQERNTDPGKYPNLLEQAKWRFWKRTTGSGGQEKLDRSNKRYRYVKDAGTACFFSDLTLEKNHLYWFSCRIRMENPEIGNAGFTPKFYRMKDKKIIWLDGYSNTFYPPEKSKNRWVEVSGFVRTPEVAEHVRMLMGANRIKGKVWFDAPEVYLIK